LLRAIAVARWLWRIGRSFFKNAASGALLTRSWALRTSEIACSWSSSIILRNARSNASPLRVASGLRLSSGAAVEGRAAGVVTEEPIRDPATYADRALAGALAEIASAKDGTKDNHHEPGRLRAGPDH
jgi:hypothetical protein